MAVVMSVIISAMVVALAWTAGTQAQETAGRSKSDEAFYAAEVGAQRVAWYLRNGLLDFQVTGGQTSPISGTVSVDGRTYSYSTSYARVASAGGYGSTMQVTSVSTYANISYTLSEKMTPPGGGITAIATEGDINAKNISITGNVSVNGDFTTGNGNGSSPINGQVTYNGNVSGNQVPTQSSKGFFNPIDFPTMTAAIKAAASITYDTDPKLADPNFVYDFTVFTTANPVIYVKSAVTSPKFKGTGTLIVEGAVTVGAYGTNSPSYTPVNIVATGDVTLSNNIDIYGTLYVGGSLTWGKTANLTGNIYVAGASSRFDNGSGSISKGSIDPWFDPRGVGGTGGYQTYVASFCGPMP